MNMLNFIRGKIQKIEVDSPTKKCKNLSPAEQIYLDQIHNYIEAGGGYTVLKQRLFADINNNYMLDSPLVQEIVGLLRRGLEKREKEKERRCVGVVEELVEQCGRVMNQAFNDGAFLEALVASAVNFRKLKSVERDQIRERACGLFLYWHNKFQREPHYLYNAYYQRLRRQNAQFPAIPFVKDLQQPQRKPSIPQLSKQQLQNIPLIISDCEQTASTTEKYLKESRQKIDTNYVRLLKAKTKKIYALSTSGVDGLGAEEKDRLSKVYKRIRGQLKEIEKMNQEMTKVKALEKEKEFLQEKMEVISPKKTEKEIPKLVVTPIKSQKKLAEQPVVIPQPVMLTPKKLSNSSSKQQKHEQIPYDRDLLDIEVPIKSGNNLMETPKKKAVPVPVPVATAVLNSNKSLLDDDDPVIPAKLEEVKQVKVQFKMPTPDVHTNKSTDLFDIDADLQRNQPRSQPRSVKNNSAHSSTSLHERYQQESQNSAQLATPPKNTKNPKYEKLIDLDADEDSTPVNEPKLDFKRLYSANQLSPELKDLDLIGSSSEKMQSKESNKESNKESMEEKKSQESKEGIKEGKGKEKEKGKGKEEIQSKENLKSDDEDKQFGEFN